MPYLLTIESSIVDINCMVEMAGLLCQLIQLTDEASLVTYRELPSSYGTMQIANK